MQSSKNIIFFGKKVEAEDSLGNAPESILLKNSVFL